MGIDDISISKEDVQLFILVYGFIYYSFDCCFVGGIELMCMNFDISVFVFNFMFVFFKVCVVEVIDVDGFSIVFGILMGSGVIDI